ncbi:MAG TPA: FHA domain-containing protein, partial [Sandaracinaceae bacterium LLY-WYZ-13_1]|nr:FHA domain-containing protein [Sandaracinaceae bacterium LLY-WYZ-13_1]
MVAHGHPAASHAWARARLTRGTSVGEIWEISSEYPEARLTVGADPRAGWRIEAPGVRPIHCELFWDGEALWVADTHRAGGVFLDGQRVGDWMQIEGPAELRFAQAALDVETSAPLAQRMASSPQLARPVTVTDMTATPEHPSQPVFGGAAGDHGVPELDAEATRVAASPMQQAPLDADRTRVAAPGVPSAAGSNADLRPRLGGAGGGDPHESEATRMVAMPGAPPRAPAPLQGSPAPVVAPPPAAPHALGGAPAFTPPGS